MLSIDEIKKRLLTRSVRRIARETGLTERKIHGITEGRQPLHDTVLRLSEWLERNP